VIRLPVRPSTKNIGHLPPAGGVIKSLVPLRGTSFVSAFSLDFQLSTFSS